MYSIVVVLIALFWFVGLATGVVATIFLTDLEDTYIFRPIKHFVAETKNGITRFGSKVLPSFNIVRAPRV